ncbi:hypothetical protein BTBSAS_110074 [Brochothrix thermosphacta]|uniref:Uncharacterized protein n=1 Tax=Brochothrix thermosphacta TaxID=2756 RepID=A0A2X0QDH0_BROTH|nr:hypothetical protein BTBSAS_110074 [Brochothrix thermosphacta]
MSTIPYIKYLSVPFILIFEVVFQVNGFKVLYCVLFENKSNYFLVKTSDCYAEKSGMSRNTIIQVERKKVKNITSDILCVTQSIGS